MMVGAGSRVEVSSDEEGFVGVWFAAQIVSISQHSAKVRYKELLSEDGEPLLEDVPATHIRPVPPRAPKKRWARGDAVEAYDRDGWWAGVVSRVLPNGDSLVRFEMTSEEAGFPASKLRCLQVWWKGKWVLIARGFLPGSLGVTDMQNIQCAVFPPEQKRKRRRTARRFDTFLDENQQQMEDGQIFGKQVDINHGEDANGSKARESPNTAMQERVEYGPTEAGKSPMPESPLTDLTPFGSPKAIHLNHFQSPSCKEMMDASNSDIPFQGSIIRQGHATKSCMPSRLRRVELTAYYWLLQAVYSKGSLDWKREMLLTDARCLLNISSEEHACEFKRVISSGIYE